MTFFPAELYLSLDKMTEAEGCVQETSSIFPLSHHVAFMVHVLLDGVFTFNFCIYFWVTKIFSWNILWKLSTCTFFKSKVKQNEKNEERINDKYFSTNDKFLWNQLIKIGNRTIRHDGDKRILFCVKTFCPEYIHWPRLEVLYMYIWKWICHQSYPLVNMLICTMKYKCKL